MDEEEAIALLRKYAPDEVPFQKILKHSKLVQDIAVKNAKEIMETGFFVDVDFVSTASLLHDIGRFKCPPGSKTSICHGIEGAEILLSENLPAEALVAARHIGAGISRQDIKEQKLGLPDEDYLPETIEEKIIADSDNIVFNDRVGTLSEAIERFAREVSPVYAERIKKLHEEIEELKKKE